MTVKQLQSVCLASVLALTVEPVARAQHTAAHVHGEAGLTMVIEGSDVIIELTSPAMDLAGFETSPATDEQHARVQQVNRVLESLENWMRLSILEGCTSDIARSGFRDASSDHGEHTEFHAHHELTCESVEMPAVTVDLFDHFPDLEVVSVQWVTDSGQGAAQLRSGDRSLTIE